MENSEPTYSCLNCARSEEDVPLVSLRHAGSQAWICSQCLPLLIHHPHRLTGKLKGADALTPVPPDSQ
jgi:hypothetical protein